MPPYLAGREKDIKEFEKLLEQDIILDNMVLTGLRGVGKTVLLETFKPLAIKKGWLWVGTDLSEAVSVSETMLAVRLITDLSVVTSSILVSDQKTIPAGFHGPQDQIHRKLDFTALSDLYESTPGLVGDKLKNILEVVWTHLSQGQKRGVIFAYDEAQNLADTPAREQYPLSLLLDLFQSIQRKNIPLMLVLTGLPTLFPKLVEARTFAERMFRVVTLQKLSRSDSRKAIQEPIQKAKCPVEFSEESINVISDHSGGYPYFIQFICREVYDVFIQQISAGEKVGVPIDAIIRKLDTDFFAGRWAKPTDRQRALLRVIAMLDSSDGEFTVQEIVTKSEEVLTRSFGPSHVSQMLASLSELGLIYKNRYGKYSFAVPLFGQFILRQMQEGDLKN
ncbi:MAG: hypothetical protein A2Y95_02770 [Deltaproteobacteria bacterium RBG_13_65_10]|nr:MAG: hypothetical protein A2Y95_02770 [Deltaproteobacteria bacterium RBG_13_65_10]